MGFLGGGSAPKADFSGLIADRKQSAERERGIVGGAYRKLPKFTGEFKKSRAELPAAAQARRQAITSQFKTELGQGLQAQGTQQFGQAKQQILGALPELQRAAREGAAATGGLQRGGAETAVNRPVEAAGAKLGQVAGDIALQSRQAQNQALSSIYQGDQGFELKKLGIDLDTAQQLLDMGRGDILDEAMKMAGIERGMSSDILSLGQSQLEANLASQGAAAQRRAALIGSLAGVGGTVAGGFAGRAPAPKKDV